MATPKSILLWQTSIFSFQSGNNASGYHPGPVVLSSTETPFYNECGSSSKLRHCHSLSWPVVIRWKKLNFNFCNFLLIWFILFLFFANFGSNFFWAEKKQAQANKDPTEGEEMKPLNKKGLFSFISMETHSTEVLILHQRIIIVYFFQTVHIPQMRWVARYGLVRLG